MKKIEISKLITTQQAMKILSIEGRPLNWRTFIKFVNREKVNPELVLPQGSKLWDMFKIQKLAKKMPKIRKGGPVPWF